MPDLYRIFDTTLNCDFPLPELPLASVTPGLTRGPSLSVKLGEGDSDQFDSHGFKKYLNGLITMATWFVGVSAEKTRPGAMNICMFLPAARRFIFLLKV